MYQLIPILEHASINLLLKGAQIRIGDILNFSNFVDHYVLEENIVASYGLMHAVGGIDKTPFYLPNNPLNILLMEISTLTTGFHDNVPFFYESPPDKYDYWLRLTESERNEIVFDHNNLSQDTHLALCKQLDHSIKQVVGMVDKTKQIPIPSVLNIIPFMAVYDHIETPTRLLYKEVVNIHKKTVGKILELQRPRAIYIPPVMSILLSRCSSIGDIAHELTELRLEFTDLRKEISAWQNEMEQGQTLDDQINLRLELDNSINRISAKYEQRRIGIYKNVAGAFLSSFEDGNLSDILSKPVVALGKELIDLFPDLWRSKRFTGFTDILSYSYDVKEYASLLQKSFGDEIADIQQFEITNIKNYSNFIQKRFGYELSDII